MRPKAMMLECSHGFEKYILVTTLLSLQLSEA